MPRKFIDQEQFHQLAERGEGRGVGVSRVTVREPFAYRDGNRKIGFCFSDGSVDRIGDSIAVSGWKLATFLRNPVALWAHDSLSPPIGRASNLRIEGERLMGDIEFATAEIYPFAETIYQMIRERFISAVSVGFIPLKYSFSHDKERPFGVDFIEQELVEISVVPVPANANALVEGRAKGFDASRLGDRDYRLQTIERLQRAERCMQAAALPSDIVIEASLAGCAIDRQRERYRKDQHDRLRREVRLLQLGLKQKHRTRDELGACITRMQYLSGNQYYADIPCAVTVVPTKSFATVGGIVEINLIALTNGAARKKEVVETDIPGMAAYGPCIKVGEFLLPSGLMAIGRDGHIAGRTISPGFAGLAHAGHIQAEAIYAYAEALCQAAGTTMAKLLRAQYFLADIAVFPGVAMAWSARFGRQPHPFVCVQTPTPMPAPGTAVIADFWISTLQ